MSPAFIPSIQAWFPASIATRAEAAGVWPGMSIAAEPRPTAVMNDRSVFIEEISSRFLALTRDRVRLGELFGRTQNQEYADEDESCSGEGAETDWLVG